MGALGENPALVLGYRIHAETLPTFLGCGILGKTEHHFKIRDVWG
jgi:hypothetical protein